MASNVFDRETMLDLLVNVIPLGILIFFIALFVVDNSFGGNPIYTYLQFGIVVVTFGLLLVLTYFSGRAIATDEERTEGTIWGELPPGGVPADGEPSQEGLPSADGEEADDDAADAAASGDDAEDVDTADDGDADAGTTADASAE